MAARQGVDLERTSVATERFEYAVNGNVTYRVCPECDHTILVGTPTPDVKHLSALPQGCDELAPVVCHPGGKDCDQSSVLAAPGLSLH